jgi:DNA-binding NtrC family response regulator
LNVQHAASLDEAVTLLDKQRFHICVIDLHLNHDNVTDEQGIELVRLLKERNLMEVMPIIMQTGFGSLENALKAMDLKVFAFLKKEPQLRQKLIDKINSAFSEKCRINFELCYDAGSDNLLPEIVKDISWAGGLDFHRIC